MRVTWNFKLNAAAVYAHTEIVAVSQSLMTVLLKTVVAGLIILELAELRIVGRV